ncbi:hypothetical protein [Ruminococcus sp.]|uniref:hypothetical protein n=1 Tax=Ruminococcus sp. TaxID=41978 RepID=UPI0025F1A881|nr:hypothetical protein [Ruminococcus sp.]MBQ8966221.1 hypothetical protein [Ruminococcus sp.]
MKLFNKLWAFAMAGVICLSSGIAAFADETDDKYVTDASMVTTDTEAPTLSFDTPSWSDYVGTADTDVVKFELKSYNKSVYQGQSLSVRATSSGKVEDTDIAYNWECLDESNQPIFEAEKDESKKYINMGVELDAEKFGLECFNGATITFKYRIGTDAKGLFMANRFFAAPADADGNIIPDAKVSQFVINTAEANNVDMYANGVISVADLTEENNIPAAKFIIMLPVHSKADDVEVLSLDNLTVALKSGAQIKNVDDYNKNATANEGQIEVVEKQKRNSVDIDENDETTKGKVKKIISIVGISLLAIVVIVGIVFAIIKAKKRFY